MAWIKRNLLFVISGAVGLLLTGYCGYLLYTSLSANAGASEEYQSTVSSLEGMQAKVPFPSQENIKAVKADQENIRHFLTEFRKSFSPFPTPPAENDKGFKIYLASSIVQFRAEATNAGVELPPDYSFSFASLREKLNYPPGNIALWMTQLEEIRAILDILYKAKINYLASLCRVPVSADDTGAGDCLLQATSLTTPTEVVTPYKITFRGFSVEISAVLEGFARSSNCFIVKAIDISPDKTVQTVIMPAAPQQQQMPAYAPQPNPYPGLGRMERERGGPGYRPPQRPMTPAPNVPGAASASAAAPVMILSESPLSVTLSVDVIKLKASEH